MTEHRRHAEQLLQGRSITAVDTREADENLYALILHLDDGAAVRIEFWAQAADDAGLIVTPHDWILGRPPA